MADLGQSQDSQAAFVHIERPAERCFRYFCAVERIPEWLPEVRSARVRHFDDEGRPAVVDYLASGSRAGIVYSVAYTYDPDGLAVAWQSAPTGPDLLRVEGLARFLPQGRACEMHYENRVGKGEALPAWAASMYRDRPLQELLAAFKAWVEGEAGGP